MLLQLPAKATNGATKGLYDDELAAPSIQSLAESREITPTGDSVETLLPGKRKSESQEEETAQKVLRQHPCGEAKPNLLVTWDIYSLCTFIFKLVFLTRLELNIRYMHM